MGRQAFNSPRIRAGFFCYFKSLRALRATVREVTLFSTSDIAAASGVEKATVRSWLARAPGFDIGRYDGVAKAYTRHEAIAMLIAGELIRRGLGVPFEVLPFAARIARGVKQGTAWVHRDRNGALSFSETQPNDVAVALPLDALAARLGLPRHDTRERIGRYTR